MLAEGDEKREDEVEDVSEPLFELFPESWVTYYPARQF